MDLNKENIVAFFKEKGAYVILAILLIGCTIFVASRFQAPGPNRTQPKPVYNQSFFVTSLDFGIYSDGSTTTDALVINFSQPVDPHEFSHYFEITPNLKGRFVQGNSVTEVKFIPEIPFQTGFNYSIKIKEGLVSQLMVQMKVGFSKIVYLKFDPEDFKILKNDKYYLLQSLSLYDLGALKAQIGSAIRLPNIKIYRTDDPKVVISDILSYTAPSYGSYTPQFETDVSKLTFVSEQKNIAHNDTVQLPKQPGIYLIQAFNNEIIASQVWVTVNTMGIHFRQDDQKFLLAAQDLDTGEPVLGVEVTAYNEDNKKLTAVRTVNFSGIGEFSMAYPDIIDIAIARKGSEYAFIPVAISGSLAEISVYQNLSEQWQSFIYTERPIYKPTDVIKFRGIIRKDNDGLYVLPPKGTKVSVTLRTYSGGADTNEPLSQEVILNENGVFFGEFAFSGKVPAVYYLDSRISATNEYLSGGQAWVEILEYKKPPFELKVGVDKEEYVEGDVISVNLKGSNFNGTAFGRQKVNYKVYARSYYETEKSVYNKSFIINSWGGMCGGGGDFDPFYTYYGELVADSQKEITFDQNGEAKISFDTKTLTANVSQELTFVIEKQDPNGNLISDAKSTIVHNGDVNIFVRPFKNQYKDAPEPTAVFTAETLSGDKLTFREFDYSIEQADYKYENGKYERNARTVKSGKVQTNGEGVGEFKVSALNELESGYDLVEVRVSTKDSRGNVIVGSQNLYIYGYDYQYQNPVLLTISSPQNNLKAGDRAKMKIIAPEDMTVLLGFERGRVYDMQWLKLNAGENTYEFTVKDEYVPSITPTFSGFYKNHYYNEGLTFNVPAMNKLQNISVTTDKSEYSQGQVARVKIKVTNSKGQPVRTSMSLGIIDKAIFALRKSTQEPLHSSFYFFRPRRTNNSSSMTGISFGSGAEQGGGGGDGLSSLFGKDVDVLYWDPEINTNEIGEAEIFVPVTGNTVWKGVIYSSSQQTDLGQADFEFSSR